jgi:hypothetical protein
MIRIQRCLVAVILCAPLAGWPAAAEETADVAAWTETFDSEAALDHNWNYYGYLPEGGTTGAREQRARWWQVVDGQLQGNIQPAVHGSGIGRNATGTDVRLAFRFKLPPQGMVTCSLRGDNPIVEKNFAVMSLHVRSTGVAACDNATLHPKESPEAAKLKAEGGWNRRFFYGKEIPMTIAEGVWHELVMEARGREQRVLIDGREVLTYTTLAGDTPKTSVGLGLGSIAKEVVHGFIDDITFGPLDAIPPATGPAADGRATDR